MKNTPSFHCHQGSLDTASTPEAFANKEKELETGALTVTDHGTMGSCRKVYSLAKKNGLIPILGQEGYFRDDTCPILAKHGIEGEKLPEYFKYGHITMHFMDQDAYNVGGRVLSDAYARAERHGSEVKPLYDWNQLEEILSNNVTIGSSCLAGMVSRHILSDKLDIAVEYYEKLRSLVKPGNFYVELFPHKCDKNWVAGVFLTIEGEAQKKKYWLGKKFKVEVDGTVEELNGKELSFYFRKTSAQRVIKLIGINENRKWVELEPKLLLNVEAIEDFIDNECRPWCPDGDVQKGCNVFMMELAKRYGDPCIVSDDSHYADISESTVQTVRLMANGTWRFYGTYERKSSEASFEYFKNEMGVDQRQFEEWVDNSLEWSQKFKDFTFKKQRYLPTNFYPQDTLKHTMQLIKEHGRMDWNNKEMVDRLKQEIDRFGFNKTIDFLPYFFPFEEVCRMYRDNGRLTGVGRGSAGGVLLSYLLGITHVNPLKYGLSLDRFMTEDRIESGKFPDIDQDLSDRELLVNEKSSLVTVEFDDGTQKVLPKTTIVKTDEGSFPLEKAMELGLEIKEILS